MTTDGADVTSVQLVEFDRPASHPRHYTDIEKLRHS
jgi:hypothetical protein